MTDKTAIQKMVEILEKTGFEFIKTADVLDKARRLAAEEKAQRASAPASLVDKIYDLAQSRNGDGCDPIWPSELLEVISCYRPAPDRTAELVKRLRAASHNGDFAGVGDLQEEIENAIADFEKEEI